MTKGFIVWNQTTYDTGYQFFGVYRTRKEAEARLREVVKKRFGKLPRDWDELIEWEGDEDSFNITKFDGDEDFKLLSEIKKEA